MQETIRSLTLPDGRLVKLTRHVTFDLTVSAPKETWTHITKSVYEEQSNAEAALGAFLADTLDTARRVIADQNTAKRPLGVVESS